MAFYPGMSESRRCSLSTTPTWRGLCPDKWANKSKPLVSQETLQKSQFSTNRMIACLMENLTIKYEMRWITMPHNNSACSWIRTHGAIVTPLRPSDSWTSLSTSDASSEWWRGTFADSASSKTWLYWKRWNLHQQIPAIAVQFNVRLWFVLWLGGQHLHTQSYGDFMKPIHVLPNHLVSESSKYTTTYLKRVLWLMKTELKWYMWQKSCNKFGF